jgi:hypothetical protein
MHIKPLTKGTSPPDPSKRDHWFRAAWRLWFVFMVAPTQAANIYRCGNAYSSTSLCANGHAEEINTHTEPRYNSLQPTSPAVTELREAEALERKRLASENRVGKQNPPRVIVTSPSTHGLSANTATAAQTQPTPNRRVPHLYFTAKDPQALPKKKGNAQALPPLEK